MIKEIIKFSAEWCGPCKTLAPIFHKVSQLEEYNDVQFKEVDIDEEENSDLVTKCQIRNIPTIIVLDENEQIIKRLVGSMTEQQLTTALKELPNG